MAYIFLDESGDLGFDLNKQGTSRFFIVTFLFTETKRPIEKLVREIHRGLRKKYRMKSGVLHAAGEEKVTIIRLCKKLVKMRVKIMTVFLDKQKVHTDMKSEKPVLYNYIVNILLDRILNKKILNVEGLVELVASRRETSKFLNLNFENYIKQQAKKWPNVKIEVKIKTPFQEKGLQAADVISWSIFKKYENQEDKFYDLLKPIIVEENAIFP